MVNHKDNRKQKSFIIFTPEHVKNLPGLNVYAIYPDYWGESINLKLSYKDDSGRTISYKTKHNWGEIPCLGYVKEQSEYWAGYAAITAGILPANATFNARAVLIKTKASDLTSEVMKHQERRRSYRKYHSSTKK